MTIYKVMLKLQMLHLMMLLLPLQSLTLLLNAGKNSNKISTVIQISVPIVARSQTKSLCNNSIARTLIWSLMGLDLCRLQ
jgi:hypothetical protein